MSVFPFIEAEKQGQRNVAKACALLEVSRSAFYQWHQHLPSARALADEDLGERVQRIHDKSRGVYGWPRVHRALRREGVQRQRQAGRPDHAAKGPGGPLPAALDHHHRL